MNTYIAVLGTVWFSLWTWNTLKPLTQKGYFKKKVEGVKYMIWDNEFKRFKSLEIREEVRQDYDRLKARLESLEKEIAKESEKGGMKDTNIDEFKRLEDKKVRLELDIKARLDQINEIDAEVNGAKPSADNPNGSNGLNQLLDSLRELYGLLENYIKII